MRLYVQGVGVWAPGLTNWSLARAVLTGRARYVPEVTTPLASQVLAPRERRRSTVTVRLALEVGGQACAAAEAAPADLPSVFSSSSGDLQIVDYMCKMLADSQGGLSPTRFHNSVHNAPSGYWTIGVGCHASSSSLSAGDDSFAAGLLEAGSHVLSVGGPVLLVAYDAPGPFPVSKVYPITVAFGVALVLTNVAAARSVMARLDINRSPAPVDRGRMSDDRLEELRCANPIAVSLPLLAALAGMDESEVGIAFGSAGSLAIKTTPCP